MDPPPQKTGWRTLCARTPAFLRASSNLVKAPSQVCRSVIGGSMCKVAISPPRLIGGATIPLRQTNAPTPAVRPPLGRGGEACGQRPLLQCAKCGSDGWPHVRRPLVVRGGHLLSH